MTNKVRARLYQTVPKELVWCFYSIACWGNTLLNVAGGRNKVGGEFAAEVKEGKRTGKLRVF